MASKIPPEPLREELPTDSQSAKLVYGVAILLPIVTVVVCLRTYTRRFVVRWMGVDDWMVLCCWVSRQLITTEQTARCRAVYPS